MSTKKRIKTSGVQVEAILPLLEACGIQVINPASGAVTCPGIDLHTKPNAFSDCVAFNNNGFPRLHCFHKSCRFVRDSMNAELYRVARDQRNISGPVTVTKASHAQQRAYEDGKMKLKREQKLAASAVPAILQEYHWPLDSIVADSPVTIDLSTEQHWRLILGLFPASDVVWIGRDKRDSGSMGHRHRFRTAGQWLLDSTCPRAFICPNAFQSGVYSRLIEHVLAPRFLVLESDDALNRDEVGAVFRWVESSLSLRLRAVVDSGNKSLHGWFDYPSSDVFQKLRLWLPAMGCDPALFTLNQPCRLPGAWRCETQRHQRLLYIA